MRRLIASLSALCLIGVIGCDKHVAGICDCDNMGHNCYGCCAWHHFAPGYQTYGPHQELVKEAAKEMPKELPKALPNKEGNKDAPIPEGKGATE